MSEAWQEFIGRTIEEALENGLEALQVTEEDVEIQIVDEGSKALLGLFGGKMARVALRQRDNPTLRAQIFLQQVLPHMGVEARIYMEDDGERLSINMEGPHMGMLIGRRGETLDALQYLTALAVNKNTGEGRYRKVLLDTEGYRQKREEALTQLAQRLADRVAQTSQPAILEPMNPYERRILHSALQDHDKVTTHSEGEEPNRHVIITLK